MLKAGSRAPDFSLYASDGKKHSLSEQKGKWLLVYFYPKDDTPGCTREGCAVRDRWRLFQKANMAVYGISADEIESHRRFSEKFSFPHLLLSDPDRKVLRQYGAWQKKKMAGREYMGIVRMSYLIDPDGKIAKTYQKVKPDNHADEVLSDVFFRKGK